jgi:hypothetical protein
MRLRLSIPLLIAAIVLLTVVLGCGGSGGGY